MNPDLRGVDPGQQAITLSGLVVGAEYEDLTRGKTMVACGFQKCAVSGQVKAGKGEVGEVPLSCCPEEWRFLLRSLFKA